MVLLSSGQVTNPYFCSAPKFCRVVALSRKRPDDHPFSIDFAQNLCRILMNSAPSPSADLGRWPFLLEPGANTNGTQYGTYTGMGYYA
jgi:hypothetical protein